MVQKCAISVVKGLIHRQLMKKTKKSNLYLSHRQQWVRCHRWMCSQPQWNLLQSQYSACKFKIKYRVRAGYNTLLLAVYKTFLFSGGSKYLLIRPHFFRSFQVAVYKTLPSSEGPNLQKIFFQIWFIQSPKIKLIKYMVFTS